MVVVLCRVVTESCVNSSGGYTCVQLCLTRVPVRRVRTEVSARVWITPTTHVAALPATLAPTVKLVRPNYDGSTRLHMYLRCDPTCSP